MLNKSLVIAALTSSASAAVAAAAKPAAGAAAAKPAAGAAAAKPAAGAAAVVDGKTVVITPDSWEDQLQRDLCDDYGTLGWEAAAKSLATAKAEETRLTKEVKDNAAAVTTAKGKYDPFVTASGLTTTNKGKIKTETDGLKNVETALGKLGTAAAVVAVTTATRDTAYNLVKNSPTSVDGKLFLQYTGGNLKTVAEEVQKKAALLLTAQTDRAERQAAYDMVLNMLNDAKRPNLDIVGATTLVTQPKVFTDPFKTAQEASRLADRLNAEATYDVQQLTEQTAKASYLFRVAGRIKTGTWDSEKCEKKSTNTAGARKNPLCIQAESSQTASTSVWTWPTSMKCDATDAAAATCQIRGLRDTPITTTTLVPSSAGAIQQPRGLIDMMDDVIATSVVANPEREGLSSFANHGAAAGLLGLRQSDKAAVTAMQAHSLTAAQKYYAGMSSYQAAVGMAAICWKAPKAVSKKFAFADDRSTHCTPLVFTAAANTKLLAKQQIAWSQVESVKATAGAPNPFLQQLPATDSAGTDYSATVKLNAAGQKIEMETAMPLWRDAHKSLTKAGGTMELFVTARMKLWYGLWVRAALAEEEAYVAGMLATATAQKSGAWADGTVTTTSSSVTDGNMVTTTTKVTTVADNRTYDKVTKLAATKNDARLTWSTFRDDYKTLATLTAFDTATTGTIPKAALALDVAKKALDALVKEGTDVSGANTAWRGAAVMDGTAGKTTFGGALDVYAKAVAAQKIAVADRAAYITGKNFETDKTALLDVVKASAAAGLKAQTDAATLVTQQAYDEKVAKAAWDLVNNAQEKRKLALAKAKGDVKSWTAVVKQYKDQCADAAFNDAKKDMTGRVAAAKKVADAKKALYDAYKKASAFPAALADKTIDKGGLCAMDATTKVRPACKEVKDKPLCCGAAQRFLKDGTKLVVETCQDATATTYTYYPEMKSTDNAKPATETWRFQCISAAQKLAAAATAALAAGYMMA